MNQALADEIHRAADKLSMLRAEPQLEFLLRAAHEEILRLDGLLVEMTRRWEQDHAELLQLRSFPHHTIPSAMTRDEAIARLVDLFEGGIRDRA